MLKKLTTGVTVLASMTLLVAPLVLAQTEDTSGDPIGSTTGPQVLYYVNCGSAHPAPFGDLVYGDPVYENGLVGLPDGSMVSLSAITVADTCAVPLQFGEPGAQEAAQGFLQYQPAAR